MKTENDVKFLVFSDFHYKKGMYAPSVENLEQILRRASDEGAEFIIHAGDFCNSYNGSPELVRLLMQNPYGLKFYGVFGNHELEADTIDYVLPLISNDTENLVFGSADGAPSTKTAYYYRDIKSYRFVFLDTNYSYNEEGELWQRNVGLARPKENVKGDSLGPVQFKWLEETLLDAADKGLHCVLTSHAGFSGQWQVSPDHKAVRELIARVNGIRERSVILVMNGHYHTNHLAMIDGVLYFDVNTAINGHWQSAPVEHYFDEHTFLFTDYDENGNKKETRVARYSDLTMAKKTWFFRDPLSAVVSLKDGCDIEIEGSKTSWVYGILPPEGINPATVPIISSGKFKAGK